MRSKTWLVLLGGILVLCLLMQVLFSHLHTDSMIAEIYQDGQLVERIDLASLTEPKEIHLTSERGENVILAEPGQISMHSASCPDRLCVHQGVLKSGVYPIVCLPNRVTIRLRAESHKEIDAITQ